MFEESKDAHIQPLRLYFLSQDSDFNLNPEEREHFRHCAECQHIVSVFARQFSEHRPPNDKPQDA
ncbi:MAG TPA: hypothetical protein VKY31_07725 [Terriglobia bacterium]|nr:hypothetical protein [Terriglobia bacterium]